MLAAMRRCWPFIWPYRRALGLGALLSLVSVAIASAAVRTLPEASRVRPVTSRRLAQRPARTAAVTRA